MFICLEGPHIGDSRRVMQMELRESDTSPLCMFYRDIKMIDPYRFKCLHKILKETWIDKRN